MSPETAYDNYSTMLYSMALEISPSEKEAEKILIGTFESFYSKNSIQQSSPYPGIALIKLLFKTARKTLKQKGGFKLKEYEYTPFLQKLLVEEIKLERYCRQHKMTRKDAMKRLRAEMDLLGELNRHAALLAEMSFIEGLPKAIIN